MKRIYFIAILALSFNAFAQNKQSSPFSQHPTLNVKEHVRPGMDDSKWAKYNPHSELIQDQFTNHPIHNPLDLYQIYDSAYLWVWDTLSMDWMLYLRDVNFVYDDNYNFTSCISQTLNGNLWENAKKITRTFDSNNNKISELYQIWDCSTWLNYYQLTYTYDANNYPIISLCQNWNGSSWENSFLYTHSYDENFNLTSTLGKAWNDNSWEDCYLVTFTYDANYNLIYELEQSGNGILWVNSSQTYHYYDGNNNEIKSLSQIWLQGSYLDYWYTFLQTLNFYDANNFKQSNVYTLWNPDGDIEKIDSTYFYFHTVLGINDLMAQDGNINVYPNPTNGKFTISSKSSLSSIEIYNLLGELIRSDFTFIQQTSTEIDITNEPKGIYFANLKTGNKVYNRKIIIQ